MGFFLWLRFDYADVIILMTLCWLKCTRSYYMPFGCGKLIISVRFIMFCLFLIKLHLFIFYPVFHENLILFWSWVVIRQFFCRSEVQFILNSILKWHLKSQWVKKYQCFYCLEIFQSEKYWNYKVIGWCLQKKHLSNDLDI